MAARLLKHIGGIDPSATPLNPIEKLCSEIEIDIPDDLETSFRSEECIYRVPAPLRDLNETAYTPRVISIGPIHHDHEKLKAMETQKKRYLKEYFWRLRVEKEQRKILLTKLLTHIKDREVHIRRHYVDIDTSEVGRTDQFVKMILLDAVFIFELFLRNDEHRRDNSKYQDDFIIGKPWLRHAIQRDLILLENQLPFSTLVELYGLATSKNNFIDLSFLYFDNYKMKSKPNKTLLNFTEPNKTILHFTDLVRYFVSFKHPDIKLEKEEPKRSWVRWFVCFKQPDLKLEEGEPIKTLYSATMLEQAGIKFKPSPGESLLDIRAWKPLSKEEQISPLSKEEQKSPKKGVLLMPPLEIDSNTECLLRNLMALEQFHYPGEEYVCRYVKLLDFLVDVEKDVDLLIENKVIVSKLGDSEAVAKLINKLCREMVEVSSSFDPLSNLLNDYYESSWNKNKAYLVSVYFKNVWIGTGTVAGFLILAITVTRFILYLVR